MGSLNSVVGIQDDQQTATREQEVLRVGNLSSRIRRIMVEEDAKPAS